MDWLSGWLKSIILIILLATFVDILLPSQTMQRYVKTVIGLFILLALLQPLFSLFNKMGTMDQLLAQAMRQSASSELHLYASDSRNPGQTEMQSVATIQQQAEQLKARQEEQSQRLMQQQVSDLMKKSIEQKSGVKVQKVEVGTTKDNQGQVVISHVMVTAFPKDASKSESGLSQQKMVTIEPMSPVDIQIRPSVKEGSGGKAPETPVAAGSEQEQTQIRMLLNQEWQVPLEQVTVNIVAGKVKS